MIQNEYLRHTLSTIQYRFQKSVSLVKSDFGKFAIGKGSRTPNEIISYMCNLVKWTRDFINEETYIEKDSVKLELSSEVQRFDSEIRKLDDLLIEKEIDIYLTKKLIQGPLSDILTHIGQIAMLSRMYGKPIKGENFSAAEIKVGRLTYFSNNINEKNT